MLHAPTARAPSFGLLAGHDSLSPGLVARESAFYRHVMPAVGVVVSHRAARHLLLSLPISASIDQTLSDYRILSSPCRARNACFYLKPFAVMPGVYSGRGLFGGEGLGAAQLDSSRRGADWIPPAPIDATEQEVHLANASWCCERHTGSNEHHNWKHAHYDWENMAELRCATPCRTSAVSTPSYRLRNSVEKVAARLGSAGATDELSRSGQLPSCLQCGAGDLLRYSFHATISVAGGGKYAAE